MPSTEWITGTSLEMMLEHWDDLRCDVLATSLAYTGWERAMAHIRGPLPHLIAAYWVLIRPAYFIIEFTRVLSWITNLDYPFGPVPDVISGLCNSHFTDSLIVPINVVICTSGHFIACCSWCSCSRCLFKMSTSSVFIKRSSRNRYLFVKREFLWHPCIGSISQMGAI